MSSMLSAPVSIPATIEHTFAAASDPAPPGTVSFAVTRAPSPARRASRITGTNSAELIKARFVEGRTGLRELSRPGARFRDCSQSVSSGRSPNPACVSPRTIGHPHYFFAGPKGRLRGKQPKLKPRQEAYVAELYRAGGHTTAELAELFGVARSTIYRGLQRNPPAQDAIAAELR